MTRAFIQYANKNNSKATAMANMILIGDPGFGSDLATEINMKVSGDNPEIPAAGGVLPPDNVSSWSAVMAVNRLKPQAEDAISTIDADRSCDYACQNGARMEVQISNIGPRLTWSRTEFEIAAKSIDSALPRGSTTSIDDITNDHSVIGRSDPDTIAIWPPDNIGLGFNLPRAEASHGLEELCGFVNCTVEVPGVEELPKDGSYLSRRHVLYRIIGKIAIASGVSFIVGICGTVLANSPIVLYL